MSAAGKVGTGLILVGGSSRIDEVFQRRKAGRCQPRIGATADHPDKFDPDLLVRAEFVPFAGWRRGHHEFAFTHFPNIPLRVARDLAVSRGSVLPEASRSSSSQPCSFLVTAVPKMSPIASAAVLPYQSRFGRSHHGYSQRSGACSAHPKHI